MSNILRFPAAKAQRPSKFGYERVRKKEKSSRRDQLDLFSPPQGKVLRFPIEQGPFEEALALDEGGDETTARELYEKAVAEGDSVPDAYCNLGILESQAGQTSEAFECFKNALKHEQRHWETHYNLANLYFDTEEFRPARVHYELAAEIEPGFQNVYFNLGLVLAIAEEFEPAIAALTAYKSLVSDGEVGAADELLDHLHSLAGAP